MFGFGHLQGWNLGTPVYHVMLAQRPAFDLGNLGTLELPRSQIDYLWIFYDPPFSSLSYRVHFQSQSHGNPIAD